MVHRRLAAKHPLAKQNWAAEGWPGVDCQQHDRPEQWKWRAEPTQMPQNQLWCAQL